MSTERSMIDAVQPSRKQSRRITFVVRAALVSMAAALLAACADDPASPADQVAAVEIQSPTSSVYVGDVVTLTAIVKDRSGATLEGRTVEWSSSDRATLIVSATGTIQGARPGEAFVVASAAGKRDSVLIEVSDVPVSAVAVEPAELTLVEGATAPLAARLEDHQGRPIEGRLVAWQSLDPQVATVSTAGLVTARAEGVATIAATSEGKSATARVTVQRVPVARVVLSESALDLDQGETRTIVAQGVDADGNVLEGRAVTWASTNGTVAFVSAEGALYALASGTARITATIEGKSAGLDVRVDPVPAHDLLFDRPTPTNGYEIYRLPLGTPSEPIRLNAGNVSRDPSPSPDGTRFVFAVSQRDLTTGAWQHDLYVVNVNGMGMRRLTSTAGFEDQPAWSPDGTRIAFMASGEGGSDIWVVNADGTGLANLTADLGGASWEQTPAWSPDGERLAFAVATNGIGSRIWTMRADGSAKAELATDAGHDLYPTWSPAGDRIAFQRLRSAETGMDIAIAPVAGGAATRFALAGEQAMPAWSPDGALIAYAAYTGGSTGRYLIYTMRPDGTGIKLRTADQAAGGGRNPSWIVR